MVNEEILTALNNAVANGEPLRTSVEVLINSGYNVREVQEAAKFIGGGAIHLQETMPDEHLTMPDQKTFFPKQNSMKQVPPSPTPQPQQSTQQLPKPQGGMINSSNSIKQAISAPASVPRPTGPISNQLRKIGHAKPNYFKEILLFIFLILLIGVLVVTLFFRKSILSFFS
ncbi:hypothetical protein GOV14_04605 [Candidatus Pacearchaeota archaeon]|nr:hypothetical protein [Candidatus Pacearchaeota archaeon]